MTISDKIRVYELSRDLKLENKDILDAAQKLSISVKSHSSSISSEDAKKITNLINNKNSGKKILSVNKSSFKEKTKKRENVDNQNKDNKNITNTLLSEKPSKENLNKKPILIKPFIKSDNSQLSSNKKNSDKLENPNPPTILSNRQSQALSKTQNRTNNSIKTINTQKDKKDQRFVQEKKTLNNNPSVPSSRNPTRPPIQLIEKPKNLTNPNRDININKKSDSFNQRSKPLNKLDNNNFQKKNSNNPGIKNTPELVGAPIRKEKPKINSNSGKPSSHTQTSANRPSISNRLANSNRPGVPYRQGGGNRPDTPNRPGGPSRTGTPNRPGGPSRII